MLPLRSFRSTIFDTVYTLVFRMTKSARRHWSGFNQATFGPVLYHLYWSILFNRTTPNLVAPALLYTHISISYLLVTVPTTCSRPSIEMLGFMYLCIYFSVDGVLATPFDIFCSNFLCRFVRTV